MDSPSAVPSSPSITACMVAGVVGGAVGDTSMHSLDTVKTRQQAAPNIQKYKSTLGAYRTIFVQEGFRKGLYGGYSAAMLGSIPSGAIFFGTYEAVKRQLIGEWHVNDTLSHLAAGFLGDFATSIVYVPSEVLKTRMQLQGRYNNPFFRSDYNYKGLFDAVRSVFYSEGWITFFSGYKATLCRDLPFSALQFAFYEKFRKWGFEYRHSDDLGLFLELSTGAAAGGIAGVLTTPLDVFKTRLQTQNSAVGPVVVNGTVGPVNGKAAGRISSPGSLASRRPFTNIPALARPAVLRTSSVIKGLYIVLQTEGVRGLFSGVQPRFIWTSVQSSVMLLLYQQTLRFIS